MPVQTMLFLREYNKQVGFNRLNRFEGEIVNRYSRHILCTYVHSYIIVIEDLTFSKVHIYDVYVINI